MMQPLCILDANGYSQSPNEAYEWAYTAAQRARAQLDGLNPEVWLYAYREKDNEYLCAAIVGSRAKVYRITFALAPKNCCAAQLDLENPSVVDMSDALHLVELLAEALEAPVKLRRRALHVAQRPEDA